MKVKILVGEYLFNEQGLHVCDNLGFATKAEVDIEVEISEDKADHVKYLLSIDRLNRGLDATGNPVVEAAKDESIFSLEETN